MAKVIAEGIVYQNKHRYVMSRYLDPECKAYSIPLSLWQSVYYEKGKKPNSFRYFVGMPPVLKVAAQKELDKLHDYDNNISGQIQDEPEGTFRIIIRYDDPNDVKL